MWLRSSYKVWTFTVNFIKTHTTWDATDQVLLRMKEYTSNNMEKLPLFCCCFNFKVFFFLNTDSKVHSRHKSQVTQCWFSSSWILLDFTKKLIHLNSPLHSRSLHSLFMYFLFIVHHLRKKNKYSIHIFIFSLSTDLLETAPIFVSVKLLWLFIKKRKKKKN